MTDPTRDRPLVTFALFAYNQEQYIREAVEGAFSQTYEPLEIILSDDCSTDRTFEILQEMVAVYKGPHKVRVRRNQENLGFADHINTVIGEAQGIFIVWAAGDDVSLPSRVNFLIEPFSNEPQLMGTYSDIREIDIQGLPTGRTRRKYHQSTCPTIVDVIERRFSVNTQSHCFRKNVMEQFPNLNTDLTYEAPCMTLRELLLGCVEYVPEITVNYRVGSGVSTYRGNDSDRLRISEPAKVAEWRRSSAQQMLDDLNFANPEKYFVEKRILRKRARGAARLKTINMRPFMFHKALLNIIEGVYIRDTIRALIRRNSPHWCWVIYRSRTMRR